MPRYSISAAIPEDICHLAKIELAAATLLARCAPATVLQETTSDAEFESALAEGRLWVARADLVPVGFAQAGLLEPRVAHLKELDVHPDHGSRGLGRQLVLRVLQWAREIDCDSIVLTTFRDPPFNMPFYAGLGFQPIEPADYSPALARIIADETRRGLNPSRRVAMRYLLKG